jgi:D-erythronate 2-dehydrogenase
LKILVTGANGFIGRALVARILALNGVGDGGAALSRLTLCDASFDQASSDPRVRQVPGDLADPDVLAKALHDGPDRIFHLAAVPGGAAEADYDLVDDDTPPSPALSYGAQKLMMEIYLSDLARRGEVDARCIRLPGILARPRQAGGHISAYMSNIFHAIAAGEQFVCPVSKSAIAWFMSVTCVVDNLLHAARIDTSALRGARTWTLPALHLTMGELAAAIGSATCRNPEALVRYEPNEAIESQFGRYPPLRTPLADRLGFRHDGSAATMVRHALHHAGIKTTKTSKGS